MRKTGVCAKCEATRLLHVAGVADTGETPGEIREMHLAIVSAGTGWFGDEKKRRVGKLSAVVCRACGYTELYVADPASIVPDGKYVVESEPPDKQGPFR